MSKRGYRPDTLAEDFENMSPQVTRWCNVHLSIDDTTTQLEKSLCVKSYLLGVEASVLVSCGFCNKLPHTQKKQQKFISQNFGGQKSKIKALAGPHFY